MEKWFLKKRNFWPKELQDEFGLPLFLSEILSRRDLKTKEEIQKYLRKDIDLEHSPFLMKDMDKAVGRILDKHQRGEKFLLSLDYDVDGIISGAVSYLALTKLGITCECIFPHRVNDGYGLNERIVQYAMDKGFGTIITFDNGISAFEAIDFAKENGIDVIVTDHHEVPQIYVDGKQKDHLVDAIAVINPKQQLCEYPYSGICGAAIAYKLVSAVNLSMGHSQENLSEIYPLVCIATICDVMTLEDENRIFVDRGLKMLAHTDNIGLQALTKELGIEKALTVYDIGFRIGPCFNSSGRLQSAQKAFDLLVSNDREKATCLAQDLVLLNKQRKELTQEATQKAIELVEREEKYRDNVLLIRLEEVHESLVGIVAGRLKEKYHVPVIVFADSLDFYKGSARSTEEINIFEELSGFQSYFMKFGGHAMAAGLSVSKEDFEAFEQKFLAHFNQKQMDKDELYYIDNVLSFPQLTVSLAKDLTIFEPFGKGNPELVFSTKNVELRKVQLLGEKKNVLRLDFFADGVYRSFVSFDPEKILEKIKNKLALSPQRDIIGMPWNEFSNTTLDILYKVGINRYKGNEYLNLELISIR